MTDFDPLTALVVVDMQNDFADPDGGLYVEGGEEVVAVVNDLIGEAIAAGATVAYSQDWHPETTAHFAKDGGVWPVHCVAGTWGAELHPDLALEGPIVRKGTGGEDGYSAFTARDVGTGEDMPTALESILRERGIARVVVVGLARNVCVRDTALDARRLGFDTTVVLDATRSVELNPGDDETARKAMAAAGVTLV